jgi:hypothetical protein
VNMVGCSSLVKLVLASQAIYHLTPLNIPSGTLKYINKVERAFLWAAKETTTGAKCRRPCAIPKLLGGLRCCIWKNLRRLYICDGHGWNGRRQISFGLGNPCSEEDMNILFATTTITLQNGKNTQKEKVDSISSAC